MRSTVLVLAGAVALSLFSVATAQAAPHIVLNCPAEARSAVSHGGDGTWVATNQSSRIMGVRLETIGTEPALVCVYHMFGTEYWIYRRPQPDFPRCRPADGGQGFYCRPSA